MLKSVRNAFKIKEIRTRLLYTLLMLVVVRIGTQLPIPGVNGEYFAGWFENAGNAFGFFDAITGGSFENMSVFALNITPYITATIIIQLLTIAFPKLEEMAKDGEDGRKKLTAITRYLTIGLALMQSLAMAIAFGKRGLLIEYNAFNVILTVIALTAGSAAIMWIGERITENGVGNGISIVLTINIISRMPQDITLLFEQFVKGREIPNQVLNLAIIIAIIVLVVVLVVLLQGAERRIPVQYSRKVVGNRASVGGQTSHIPLKVNTAGVIPIIFAQSIMIFPVIICQLAGVQAGTGIGGKILKMLSQSNWFNFNEPIYSIGLVAYIAMVIAFAYFYTSITFNPLEIANNMKKSGGFIPGIRPGKPTSDYLSKLLSYIIFIGAVGLVIVAIIPIFFQGAFHANISFGGTSLIIVVGVVIETIKQIESRMLVRNYKGFLND